MIFIEAGHSPKKPGASAKHGEHTYKEHQLVINQRNCLLNLFKTRRPDIKVHTDKDSETSLKKVMDEFKKEASESKERHIVISLHFNAAQPGATGLEIFVPERSTFFEMEYASKMAKHFSSILKIRNRGVKPESASQHKRLAIMAINGENFLIEWGFITNEVDLMSYIHNEDKLMEELFGYLTEMHDKLNAA